MTTGELMDAADLPDELDHLADVIEASLERSGWRGMSPPRAARSAGCTTAQARTVLAHLAGIQRATGPWNHLRSPRKAAS